MLQVLKACAAPGCGALVERGRCRDHDQRRELDRHRPGARARGYDRRWERARAAYLAEHPTCAHAALEGAVVASTIVDHVVPHRGDRALFWDPTNWQALSRAAHDLKTMREAGLLECEHGAPRAIVAGRLACVLCGEWMS